ncbi:2Fe-2S iron-sulfur cluster binding domain-containing protein [Sediminicoccus sp. KRV36]|uniref:2Fe-2S iron-sulfur cluster-binding protein n=1 Tax=Sediminicoccus sp. KRV36 TaxID=3133721 RepID=UPI0020100F52|nr:2Fe-2S iron-sulfur cluster binding domain-containing protein [Sediminicoccus rosea]UPY38412.1 2Fe-2S iron-sulfur cluster binding domain-containing protein [Sediminicoccus rosea]
MSEAAVPRIRVTFVSNEGKQVEADAGGSLLRISIREKGGIPFKCGGGLCGTCKCRFEAGREHASAITAKERKHLTEDQFAAGWRMACQTFVNGDASISWPPPPPKPAPAPVTAA